MADYRRGADAAGVPRDSLIASPALTTTTKVRVLAGQHYAPRQQVIRIDYEDRTGAETDLCERMRAEPHHVSRRPTP